MIAVQFDGCERGLLIAVQRRWTLAEQHLGRGRQGKRSGAFLDQTELREAVDDGGSDAGGAQFGAGSRPLAQQAHQLLAARCVRERGIGQSVTVGTELPMPGAQIRAGLALAQQRGKDTGEGLAERTLVVLRGPGDQREQFSAEQWLGIEHGLDGAQFAPLAAMAAVTDHDADQFPGAEGNPHAGAGGDFMAAAWRREIVEQAPQWRGHRDLIAAEGGHQPGTGIDTGRTPTLKAQGFVTSMRVPQERSVRCPAR